METKRGLVWFRDNLRIHDNEPLNKALEECDEVILLYIYNRRFFEEENWGIPRMGGQKIRFLFQTVEDLKANLEDNDLFLNEAYDYPVEYFYDLSKKMAIDCIYTSEGIGTEEKEEEKKIAKFITLKTYNTDRLFATKNLGFNLEDLPAVFTNFRKKVEKNGFIESPIYFERGKAISIELEPVNFLYRFAHKMQNPNPKSAHQFMGGETMAKKHLENYIWREQHIKTYKQTRNNLIGSSYSSKFSPWLAVGALSVKEVWKQISLFENNILQNQSTYWLKFELLWREFFKWTLVENQEKLFIKNGFKQPKIIDKPLHNNNFDNWKEGKTANEFINANMIELNQTGFMSNRGRQIVASYLIYDLKIDWRLGAAYFEQMLIDYDPASNYGNWTYIAGVGNDPRGGRHFNVEKQIEMYDPNREYIDLWAN